MRQAKWTDSQRGCKNIDVVLTLTHRADSLAACQTLDAQIRDPGFPLQNTKSPRPENPRKLLKKKVKNYNLAHPGPVAKITEKLQRSVIFY